MNDSTDMTIAGGKPIRHSGVQKRKRKHALNTGVRMAVVKLNRSEE
jgi:hypothetical protein